MGKMLRDFSTTALTDAIETNLFEFLFEMFSSCPRGEVHDDPDMLWTITDIPFPLFNNVLRAQLSPSNVITSIDTVIARYQTKNVPMVWWTGPATRPEDLNMYLGERGFIHQGDAIGMAVDMELFDEEVLPKPGLSIDPVMDLESLKIWGNTLAAGYEVPDFVGEATVDFIRCLGFGEQVQRLNYLGKLEGVPVATSSVFLGSGVAGVYNVATIPSARRQGIGTIMTLVSLQEARARGYRIGVLQSTQIGLSIYSKLGFQEFCRLGHHFWFGDVHGEQVT